MYEAQWKWLVILFYPIRLYEGYEAVQYFQKKKLLPWIYIALVCALFALSLANQFYFGISSALCAFFFWLGQFKLGRLLGQEEDEEAKHCRNMGFFLLIPTLGTILSGVSLLFYPPSEMPLLPLYGGLGVSALLAMYTIWEIVSLRKNLSVAGRFLRLTCWMALSSPASLIVVLTLLLTKTENVNVFSCLSVTVFGGLAFLLALSMIMIAFCDYQSFRDSIATFFALIKKNRLLFTRASIAKDVLLVVGKSIISVVSVSFFMFVNALYSAGLGSARFIALKMHEQDRAQQIKSYRQVGVVISIASICYVLYSLRLLFGGKTGVYSMNIALVIALYTFVEFGINVRDALRLRKSHALEAKALRAISFAATLICFVLTQTAIMSFASEGDNSLANALSGIFFGGGASLVGIFVVVQSYRYQKHPERGLDAPDEEEAISTP